MPKIQMTNFKGSKHYFITIPIDIVKRKEWDVGHMLFFSLNNKDIVELKE